MDKVKNKSFIKWLEILQQESWQLELLISGFAIFLLVGAYDQVASLEHKIVLLLSGNIYYSILFIPFRVLIGAWLVLLINLVIHVLLRGLWISTIGLRYISGDIDFDLLRFSPKFDHFLKRKIVSFDTYIQQLEKLCSVVFGFTFLIIFLLISAGLFVIGIIIFAWILDGVSSQYGGTWILPILPFYLAYLFGGIIYFLDFISLGWIKRNVGFAKFYYPLYRFFGIITLAFIYRPIYYNMVDNKFGRKVVLFLIPYVLLITLIVGLSFKTQAYLPDNRELHSITNNYYDDTADLQMTSYSASMNSKFVKNGFAELYLPYVARSDDPVIAALCPDLQPAKTGLFIFGGRDRVRTRMNAEETLNCHAQRFKIYVNDSLFNNINYRFHEHPTRENIGLFTILDVGYLPRGEHAIKINVKFLEQNNGKDTLVMRETNIIPFWKE
ncbi:MAG: hypothetical protein KJN85_11080 [Maribacter sp.]|nr:hypothetical protein [Maribacter sp.]NNK18528.1 hypothetical protein [Maribacter sp.]